jgi:hypothetical protein
MAKEEEDQFDYVFPLSLMVKDSLEELSYQSSPFTSTSPAIKSFRAKDYEVGGGFSLRPAKLDEDAALLGKLQPKAVLSHKMLEEMERLTRQSISVGSHAEWVLGSVVALMDANDAPGVIRAIESINIAQRHNAALLSRLLANVTNARRDQLLAPACISSVAKASLFKLPLPLDNKLFSGIISDTVAKDAETTSKQALVSLAGHMSASKEKKPSWTMPSFKKDPKKSAEKNGGSFRPNNSYSKGTSKGDKFKNKSTKSKK